MMTIKIIKDGNEATIYEAKVIKYERMFYENKDKFMQQWRSHQIAPELLMRIPEDDYSYNDGRATNYDKMDSDKTEYIKITFFDGNDSEVIVFVQQARAYIMQGGQTVDTIHC